VVFTHVPKTGGTTLDHILVAVAEVQRKRFRRLRFSRGACSPEEHNQELLDFHRLSEDQFAPCDYLSGHFPFGVHRRVAQPCLYVTLLRDPVTRLLSNVRFGLDRIRWSRDTPVDALIQNGRLIDNVQTRQIAGVFDRDTPCTAQTLANACENLRSHYAVVGVTERFDETLKALITLLGWPDIAYSDRQVSRAMIDPKLEANVREAAERHFAFDMELHAYASARPTSWSQGIFEGIETGSERQHAVLVTSPRVRFGNQHFALLPATVFDDQICPVLQEQGGEVLIR
jgi:hypothetical protein